MKALLITLIVIFAAKAVVNSLCLMFCKYPRTLEVSVGIDCVTLVYSIAWIFWAAIVLSRMGQ